MVRVIAHRGYSAKYPEASREAYVNAIPFSDGFECDLHLTKDLKLFCWHDDTMDRTSNMTGDVNYSLALTNTNLSLNNGKGGLLSYKLFTTGNYTSLWTETNLITGTVRNVGGNGVDVKPIYGEVILLNKQRMTAGDYTNQSNPPLVKLLY